MPSTVYRGDLAEISFGHESGVYLKNDYAGTFRFHALAKYSENTSTLYLKVKILVQMRVLILVHSFLVVEQ